jgi:hypothetical protein
MSSQGLLFEAHNILEPQPNNWIELHVTWPFLLDHSCPLKLVIGGLIVRRNNKRVAVKILRHEFRTSSVSLGNVRLRREQDRMFVLFDRAFGQFGSRSQTKPSLDVSR